MTVTPRRRPDWKKLVSTALFLVLLGLLSWYVYTHRNEMRNLLSLTPETVAQLIGLGLVSAVINGLYHLSVLNTYHLRMTLVDWFGVVCVSNSIAYVLPMRADLVFSATYYKRVCGLAYTKSVSMSAGNVVFGVGFSLLQIVIALLCMGLIEGFWSPILWGVAALGAAALGFFLWLSQRTEGRLLTLLSRYKLVTDVIAGFNALIRNRTLLWQLLLCMLGSNLAHLLTYLVCFRAVGMPVTWYAALFYTSVSWLATVVAIVPGNIGIKESVMGVATLALGSVFDKGVTASLLNRVVMMIVYIALGLIFAVPVLRRFNRGKGRLDRNEDPAESGVCADSAATVRSEIAFGSGIPADHADAAGGETPSGSRP